MDFFTKKAGFLQIKLPASTRSVKIKPWHKRWVVLKQGNGVAGSIQLLVYNHDNPRTWKEVLSMDLHPGTGAVYRAFSKSHPYVFSVAEGGKSKLFLGGSCEVHCQEWMAAIRENVWPPSPAIMVEKSLAGTYQVSLIDNDYSCKAGLLGEYGYMEINEKKIILSHPHTGHIIQEWYLNSLKKLFLVPQPMAEDQNRVFAIDAGSSSPTGEGTLYLYSQDSVHILKKFENTIKQVIQNMEQQHRRDSAKSELENDLLEMSQLLSCSFKVETVNESRDLPQGSPSKVNDISKVLVGKRDSIQSKESSLLSDDLALSIEEDAGRSDTSSVVIIDKASPDFEDSVEFDNSKSRTPEPKGKDGQESPQANDQRKGSPDSKDDRSFEIVLEKDVQSDELEVSNGEESNGFVKYEISSNSPTIEEGNCSDYKEDTKEEKVLENGIGNENNQGDIKKRETLTGSFEEKPINNKIESNKVPVDKEEQVAIDTKCSLEPKTSSNESLNSLSLIQNITLAENEGLLGHEICEHHSGKNNTHLDIRSDADYGSENKTPFLVDEPKGEERTEQRIEKKNEDSVISNDGGELAEKSDTSQNSDPQIYETAKNDASFEEVGNEIKEAMDGEGEAHHSSTPITDTVDHSSTPIKDTGDHSSTPITDMGDHSSTQITDTGDHISTPITDMGDHIDKKEEASVAEPDLEANGKMDTKDELLKDGAVEPSSTIQMKESNDRKEEDMYSNVKGEADAETTPLDIVPEPICKPSLLKEILADIRNLKDTAPIFSEEHEKSLEKEYEHSVGKGNVTLAQTTEDEKQAAFQQEPSTQILNSSLEKESDKENFGTADLQRGNSSVQGEEKTSVDKCEELRHRLYSDSSAESKSRASSGVGDTSPPAIIQPSEIKTCTTLTEGQQNEKDQIKNEQMPKSKKWFGAFRKKNQ